MTRSPAFSSKSACLRHSRAPSACLRRYSPQIGIYSTVAAAVARRQREIGVRIAWVLCPVKSARMVAGDAFRIVAGGLVLGYPRSTGRGVRRAKSPGRCPLRAVAHRSAHPVERDGRNSRDRLARRVPAGPPRGENRSSGVAQIRVAFAFLRHGSPRASVIAVRATGRTPELSPIVIDNASPGVDDSDFLNTPPATGSSRSGVAGFRGAEEGSPPHSPVRPAILGRKKASCPHPSRTTTAASSRLRSGRPSDDRR